MFLTTLFVLFASILFFYKWINMKPKNFPPGPFPLPIIGSVYNFPCNHAERCIEVFSKTYGQIIGYMFGSTPMVFITGVDNVLAALRKDEFQGRPDNVFIRGRSLKNRLGVFFSDGEHWQESRRFVVKHLRAFGKKETENVMKEEIDILASNIQDGSIIQATGLFSLSTLNVIWTILANKRFALDDKKVRKFLNMLDSLFRSGQPAGDITIIFPFMKYISPTAIKQHYLMRNILGYMREQIREHEKVLDYNSPRDLIDKYLVEMHERNKAGTNTTYSEDDLVVICMDLFVAGSESTSNTIEFLIMYLIHYPEVQKKLQEELDRVLQRSRRPNLDDKNRMPYALAVISETMRIRMITPVAVPHRCTSDTTFNGYFIPKDTNVVISLWSLANSTEKWKDVNKFDPSRFIDENGQFINYPFFHPFGLAKRVCVGETLGKNILFLFVTTFFEKYSVSLPEGDPLPDTEPLPGFTNAPKPFRMKISTRY